MTKLVILLAGVALLVSSIAVAKADYIYGHLSGVQFYNARRDMTPIEVNLYGFIDNRKYTRILPIEEAEKRAYYIKPVFKMIIPRAFITGCPPYTSSPRRKTKAFIKRFVVDVLPERSVCEQLFLAYNYPSGTPLTGRMPKFKNLPKPDIGLGYVLSHKKDRKSIKSAMRRATAMSILIYPARNSRGHISWNPDAPWNKKKHEQQKYQGFRHFVRARGHSFYDNGADEILLVRCTATAKESRHNFYCNTYVPINKNLYAKLTFLDFRLNGGRAFLRQRVRNFKKHFCGYLKCDEKALQAAKIK